MVNIKIESNTRDELVEEVLRLKKLGYIANGIIQKREPFKDGYVIFMRREGSSEHTSENSLHKHFVSNNEVAVCPICNVTELVDGNCKTCTDELCKPFMQTDC